MRGHTKTALVGLAACLTLLCSCGGRESSFSTLPDRVGHIEVGDQPTSANAPPLAAESAGFAIKPAGGAHLPELKLAVVASAGESGTAGQAGQQVVSVVSAVDQPLSEVICELHYDSELYTPLAAQATQAIALLSESLCLQVIDTPGVVSLGQLALDGQARQVEAGEVLTEVLFACDSLDTAVTKAAAQVPVHKGALSPLLWDEDAGEFRWYYVNPGDYNQDGLVGISDLSPLGRELGAAGPFAFTTARSVIDGNGDGEISVADLTTIGQYWGNRVEGYNLYASPNVSYVPSTFDAMSSLDPVASFSMDEAQGDPLADRLWFSYAPTEEEEGLIFWARPFADGAEGTRSNIASTDMEAAPLGPDGFNLPPTARLSLNYVGNSVPLAVTFDASASSDPDGTIIFFEWDFQGDGLFDAFSTKPTAQHTYVQPGEYAPLVRVTDNGGLWDTFQASEFEVTETEVGNIPPVADLIATVTEGQAPLTVGLIASGSFDPDGLIVKYEWDFDGDGEYDLDSGADPTVLHVYEAAGTFETAVRAIDDQGESAASALQVVVKAPNQRPVATLAVGEGEQSGGIPHTVHFDASGSTDPEGRIKWFFWDLDGDSAYDKQTTSPFCTHTYMSAGIFNAKVLVEDDVGEFDSAAIYIIVVLSENEPPVAEMESSVSYGDAPLTVLFDARSSTDPDGTIAIFEWDWEGDGAYDAQGSSAEVEHTYAGFGVYNATLRVTDDDGAQSIDSISIHVNEVLTGPSAWWCWGRDPRHTRRSPYISAQTSNVKWSFNLDSRTSPAIGPQGIIYVGGYPSLLYAINPNGTLMWSVAVEGGVAGSTPAVGAEGTAYVPGADDKLYAVSPDGEIKWSFDASDHIRSSPTIGEDGTIYVGSHDGNVYAINPDGTEKWSYPAPPLGSAVAIAADGTIYVGGTDHRLYAINHNGTLKWTFTAGRELASPAIGTDGTIYVGSSDRKFYAINPNGSLRWSYTTGHYIFASPAIDSDGTVYIPSMDDKLRAFSPDGSLKWSYALGGSAASSPALAADGTLYLGCNDGSLYAITREGTLKWHFSFGFNGSVSASPVIGADGTLYMVSDLSDLLYAFGSSAPE